jgi:hypothetical protein
MMVLSREAGWALSELEARPASDLEFWLSVLEEQKEAEKEMREEQMEGSPPRGGPTPHL